MQGHGGAAGCIERAAAGGQRATEDTSAAADLECAAALQGNGFDKHRAGRFQRGATGHRGVAGGSGGYAQGSVVGDGQSARADRGNALVGVGTAECECAQTALGDAKDAGAVVHYTAQGQRVAAGHVNQCRGT